MKTPEETLMESMDGDDLYTAFMNWYPDWLMKRSIMAVEKAQTEAWNEAVEAVLKESKKSGLIMPNGEDCLYFMNEQSILKLKK